MEEVKSREPGFHLAAVGPLNFRRRWKERKWTSFPGYQAATLVYYSGEHVRMEFPTDDELSVEDMLKVIPFGPDRAIGEDEKYLIAVWISRRWSICSIARRRWSFYQLGTVLGV